jgi:hypothetical protein
VQKTAVLASAIFRDEFVNKFFLIMPLACLLFSLSAVGDDNVHTTSEPTTLYHWFNSPKLQSKIKSSDPKGFATVSHISLNQWFTASANPVSLRPLGGDDWVLLELNVRPGFKVLDIDPDLFSAQGCPSLTAKSSSLSPSCLKALQDVVKKFDLNGLRLGTGEIIVANGTLFRPEEVRVFNHLSTDAPQDRLKVQSLFYKADFDRFKVGLSDSLFPSEINRLNPPFSGGGRGLLWEDLDGKPLDLPH